MIKIIENIGEFVCDRNVSLNMGWFNIDFHQDEGYLANIAGVKFGNARKPIKDTKDINEHE